MAPPQPDWEIKDDGERPQATRASPRIDFLPKAPDSPVQAESEDEIVLSAAWKASSASRAVAAAHSLVCTLERQRMLMLSLAGWRCALEDSQRRRREGIFDSMAHQVKAAKQRCRAFEQVSQQSEQVITDLQMSSLQQLVISAWRTGIVTIREQEPRDVSANVRHSLQRRHSTCAVPTVPITRTSTSPVPGGLPAGGSLSVPHGGALGQLCRGNHERASSCHQDFGPLSARPPTSRSSRDSSVERSRPKTPSAGHPDAAASTASFAYKSSSQRSGRQAFGTRDVSSVEAASVEIKKPLPRGPERFFYDTTGYTGCARFGGPSVVDKENLVAPSRSKARPFCEAPAGGVSAPAEAAAAPVHEVAPAGLQARDDTPARRRMVPLR